MKTLYFSDIQLYTAVFLYVTHELFPVNRVMVARRENLPYFQILAVKHADIALFFQEKMKLWEIWYGILSYFYSVL